MVKNILTCVLVLVILLSNFQTVMAGDPVSAQEWVKAGKKSLDSNNTENALYCFEKATELDPYYAEGWYYIGVACYRINGKTTDMELKAYKKALEINPAYEKAWFARGWALYDAGKYTEAIECFDKTLDINPDNKEAKIKREASLKALNKSGSPGEVTINTIKNGTYRIYSRAFPEPVRLIDGKYEVESSGGYPLSVVIYSQDKIALGDLNGDGKKDGAVILVYSTGGSGSFRVLEAVINQKGKTVNVASTDLGDRVIVESISIASGEIIIKMITHGPNDGASNPTVRKTVRYRLNGEELIENK